MNKLTLALSIVVSTFYVNQVALSDTCLSRASNSELIDELSARLSSGSTPGGHSSLATFTCAWTGDMTISLTNESGVEHTQSVSIGNAAHCNEVEDLLNQTHARVKTTSMVAFCFWTKSMARYSLTPEGNIIALSSIDFADSAKCLAQEKLINSRTGL